MRIFVTGGTGFIGSHFLARAVAQGHTVLALRRPGSVPRCPVPPAVTWVEGALDDDWTSSLGACDALVHFAAVGVSPQTATWDEYFRWNVIASLGLWRQAVQGGVKRLVICGSFHEYGRAAGRYEFIPPTAELEPANAYGASKAAASLGALALARETGAGLVLLRPFTVFGEGQHEANFWPSLKAHALSGRDFPMTGGEQWRDFIPVADVAEAFMRATQSPGVRPGEPIVRNVGTGKPLRLLDFAREWWQTWKAGGKLLAGALPYRPNEMMRCVPLIEHD